jgi:hypothetical protein
VIDDHGQIAVAALVGDLVDPDPAQPRQGIHLRSASSPTRVTIAPTVRHTTRNN